VQFADGTRSPSSSSSNRVNPPATATATAASPATTDLLRPVTAGPAAPPALTSFSASKEVFQGGGSVSKDKESSSTTPRNQMTPCPHGCLGRSGEVFQLPALEMENHRLVCGLRPVPCPNGCLRRPGEAYCLPASEVDAHRQVNKIDPLPAPSPVGGPPH
jgi:hypothetical protein